MNSFSLLLFNSFLKYEAIILLLSLKLPFMYYSFVIYNIIKIFSIFIQTLIEFLIFVYIVYRHNNEIRFWLFTNDELLCIVLYVLCSSVMCSMFVLKFLIYC